MPVPEHELVAHRVLREWMARDDGPWEVIHSSLDRYLDELAAGKRVAEQIGQALAEKFGKARHASARGTRLFEPRLVRPSVAPSMP